jgi:histone H3/H4
MADQDNTTDTNRHKSVDREESDNDNVEDQNTADDMNDDEADADIDTHYELDESGRDDEGDDDDDDDDMDLNNDSMMNDQEAVDTDGEDIPIKKDDTEDSTTATPAEVSSLERNDQHQKESSETSGKSHPHKGMRGPRGGGNRKRNSRSSNGISSRAPSVRGLTIPFRTIKKIMKLDPDIPIVQNEAAIMATVAVELFLKRLVTQSHRNAKYRGRNTVRYEDVAEARTKDTALAFLETMLP